MKVRVLFLQNQSFSVVFGSVLGLLELQEKYIGQ